MEELIQHAHRTTPMFDLKGLTTLARVVSLHDGDTLRAVFKFAGTYKQFIIRVLHIDAPEIASKDPEEKQAAVRVRNRLLQLVCPGGGFEMDGSYSVKDIEGRLDVHPSIVTLHCEGPDKYNRTLARVVTDGGLDVAGVLGEEALVHRYEGGTKQKW